MFVVGKEAFGWCSYSYYYVFCSLIFYFFLSYESQRKASTIADFFFFLSFDIDTIELFLVPPIVLFVFVFLMLFWLKVGYIAPLLLT